MYIYIHKTKKDLIHNFFLIFHVSFFFVFFLFFSLLFLKYQDCIFEKEWCRMDTNQCYDKYVSGISCFRDRQCLSGTCHRDTCSTGGEYNNNIEPNNNNNESGSAGTHQHQHHDSTPSTSTTSTSLLPYNTVCNLDSQCDTGWCHPIDKRCDYKV